MDVQVITHCNSAYFDLACNLMRSLRRVGLEASSTIHATTPELMERFRAAGFRAQQLQTTEKLSDKLEYFRQGDWDRLSIAKLALTARLLRTGCAVLYADPDIVFLKDPVPDLLALSQRTGLLFQSDAPGEKICAGLYFARPTERVLASFDRAATMTDGDDQVVFNKMIRANELEFDVLAIDDFPNGQRWRARKQEIRDTASLVHYNWIAGDDRKILAMWRDSLWYGPRRRVAVAAFRTVRKKLLG